jgi:diphosphoinositol-polyphosphate diphosphatase
MLQGGVEKGESGSEACLREAWEEGRSRFLPRAPFKDLRAAGLRGKVVSCIAEDIPSPRLLDNGSPKASYSVSLSPRSRNCDVPVQIHLILVTSLEDDWPERHERDRKWVSLAEARELTTWREEMAICFDRIPSNLQELAQQP